jgi:deoxycytidine triphosphate deaminase
MPIDYSQFPADDADARDRAAQWASVDPFPSVPNSLLSSAEVHDYARVTGMLNPFFPEGLKSASYETHIGGAAIWWDQRGNRHEQKVHRGGPCKLLPNSITFVQIEPMFRLPNYIAVRFNLRITHVHRGLLLGTGPLVDPGFHGHLLVPLHNLTSSEYNIDTNEALIWIEFTKTTYGYVPKDYVRHDVLPSQLRHFKEFENRKKELTPDQYLRKANADHPIQSSIPPALEQLGRQAANAEQTAKRIQGRVTLGLIALAIALIALWYQVYGMIQSSIGLTTSVEQTLAPLSADDKATADKLTALQAEMVRLQQRLDQVDVDLNQLQHPAAPPPQPNASTSTPKNPKPPR